MRHDLVGRGVRLDAERGVGQQSDLGRWRLLHFAVLAAVDVVLPHGEIALLRQRMCDGAGVIAAERLEFFSAQSDDDFIPDDN